MTETKEQAEEGNRMAGIVCQLVYPVVVGARRSPDPPFKNGLTLLSAYEKQMLAQRARLGKAKVPATELEDKVTIFMLGCDEERPNTDFSTLSLTRGRERANMKQFLVALMTIIFGGDVSAAETAGSLLIAYESLEGEVFPEYKDIINKVSVSKYNVVRTYGMLMKRLFPIKELQDWVFAAHFV
jgi:hypothetical protein